jgi:hypothetical protein
MRAWYRLAPAQLFALSQTEPSISIDGVAPDAMRLPPCVRGHEQYFQSLPSVACPDPTALIHIFFPPNLDRLTPFKL